MQDLSHVRVDILPPHDGADERSADEDPLRLAPECFFISLDRLGDSVPGTLACTFLRLAFELHQDYKVPLCSTFSLIFERRKHRNLQRLVQNNDDISLQETHEKNEFLQALLVKHLVGTLMNEQVNAGGRNTHPQDASA